MRLPTALSILSALLLLMLALPTNAAVKAWVDDNQVAAGDTVQLTLEHDGQTSDQPDLSPLKPDFDVLSTSRSSNVQIINGSMSSQVQLQLTLAPKRAGKLTIPAINWGGEHSDSIPLDVSGSGAGNGQAANDVTRGSKVFLETIIDQPHPYVQAAVKVTVRVNTAAPLYQAALELPTNSDVLVQQIGSDQNKTLVKNGERYTVLERHYLLFPQRSGSVKIPGAELNAQVAVRSPNDPFGDDAFKDVFGRSPFNSMVTSTKPIRVHGDDIVLDVQPRPVDTHASYWLPAHEVNIKSDWHPDQLQAHVGEPVTVDLHLQADGLTAAQLPDLTSLLNLPAGIKSYPDQAKLTNDTHGDSIVGNREQSIALIADQPGKFEVPALQLRWWDTRTNQPREITLPERTLIILPAAGGVTAQTASAMSSESIPAESTDTTSKKLTSTHATVDNNTSVWLAVSAGLALLWIATLIGWYWSRCKSTPVTSSQPVHDITQPVASQARATFQQACRSNDAQQARRSLLAWVSASRSPVLSTSAATSSPPGLRALAKQLNDSRLSTLLNELDRACYAGGNWNGADLLVALHELPTPQQHRKSAKVLAPLYH